MLLRHRDAQGAEVFAPGGVLSAADAQLLRETVDAALGQASRGVVVDLADLAVADAEALGVLRTMAAGGVRWPRPSLLLCCASPELRARLGDEVVVRTDEPDALAHLDDRPGGPWERIELNPGPQAPAQGRAAVADWLRAHGVELVAEDLALVVSELVTNAVRHGRPPVVVELTVGGREVTVVVADGSSERPTAPQHAPDSAEGGRGMFLVDLLAQETGVRAEPPGKVVWARLPLDTVVR